MTNEQRQESDTTTAEKRKVPSGNLRRPLSLNAQAREKLAALLPMYDIKGGLVITLPFDEPLELNHYLNNLEVLKAWLVGIVYYGPPDPPDGIPIVGPAVSGRSRVNHLPGAYISENGGDLFRPNKVNKDNKVGEMRRMVNLMKRLGTAQIVLFRPKPPQPQKKEERSSEPQQKNELPPILQQAFQNAEEALKH